MRVPCSSPCSVHCVLCCYDISNLLLTIQWFYCLEVFIYLDVVTLAVRVPGSSPCSVECVWLVAIVLLSNTAVFSPVVLSWNYLILVLCFFTIIIIWMQPYPYATKLMQTFIQISVRIKQSMKIDAIFQEFIPFHHFLFTLVFIICILCIYPNNHFFFDIL